MVSIFNSIKNFFIKKEEKRLYKQKQEYDILLNAMDKSNLSEIKNKDIRSKMKVSKSFVRNKSNLISPKTKVNISNYSNNNKSYSNSDVLSVDKGDSIHNLPMNQNSVLIKKSISDSIVVSKDQELAVQEHSLITENMSDPAVINKRPELQAKNNYKAIYQKHVQDINLDGDAYNCDLCDDDPLYGEDIEDNKQEKISEFISKKSSTLKHAGVVKKVETSNISTSNIKNEDSKEIKVESKEKVNNLNVDLFLDGNKVYKSKISVTKPNTDGTIDNTITNKDVVTTNINYTNKSSISDRIGAYYSRYEKIEEKLKKKKPKEFKKFSTLFSEKSNNKPTVVGLNRYKHNDSEKEVTTNIKTKKSADFEFLNISKLKPKNINTKISAISKKKDDTLKYNLNLNSSVKEGSQILKKLKKFGN